MTEQPQKRVSEQPDPSLSPSSRERFAAFRGFLEAFRRLPSAFRRPETLMLTMAILASIGVHLPSYMGLGALAKYWEEEQAKEEKKKQAEPAEVSFEFAENEPPEDKEAEAAPEPEEKTKPEAPSKPEKAKEKPKPKPEPKKEAQVAPPPPAPTKPVPPPPQQQERKQSITQKSDDPDVEPPPDARFLAEQSRRVEEETMARVRDEVRDDPEPEAAAARDRGVEEAGNERKNTPSMSESGQDKPVEKTAALEPPPPPPAEQSAPERTTRPGSEPVAEQAEVAPSNPLPGTVIQDPLGSFTLATEDAPSERQQARSARAGGSAGRSGAGKPNLNVTWQAFENTYDVDTLERERVPQRRTRIGSSQRKRRMQEYRAAIENYVRGVKPGNHTALNAAADPFAAYIAAFHRHLHEEFAYRFLGSLPAVGELSDFNLVTKVEMVINPDGTLQRVGIVGTSGQTMFDLGAFTAVKDGEPYPAPPQSIRSADGRVYLRWALHRDHSQCGTWNAEPYIVSDPPDVADDDPLLVPPSMRNPPGRGPG